VHSAADIDFREVFARNRILYVELNAQLQEKLARSIARLMLEDFKQLSGRLSARPDERHPFSLYIDEARYSLYDGFVGLITQCRSAGIGVVVATHGPFDFRSGTDDQVLRAVAQNTNTKLFFCQKDHESAEYCARQAGTCDTIKRTTQMIDEGVLGDQAEIGRLLRLEVKEFIAHPDELKRMWAGKALLIRGTEDCEVIEVEYRPTALQTEFAPTLPRTWRPGDSAWLGHSRPALDLHSPIDREQAASRANPSNAAGLTRGPVERPALAMRAASCARRQATTAIPTWIEIGAVMTDPRHAQTAPLHLDNDDEIPTMTHRRRPLEATAAAQLPPVLCVEELAALLRVNRKTAYEAVSRGRIPGTRRFGRTIRIDRAAVLEWLRGHGSLSGSPPRLGGHDEKGLPALALRDQCRMWPGQRRAPCSEDAMSVRRKNESDPISWISGFSTPTDSRSVCASARPLRAAVAPSGTSASCARPCWKAGTEGRWSNRSGS
jgi:excisionase family DNA binding protein